MHKPEFAAAILLLNLGLTLSLKAPGGNSLPQGSSRISGVQPRGNAVLRDARRTKQHIVVDSSRQTDRLRAAAMEEFGLNVNDYWTLRSGTIAEALPIRPRQKLRWSNACKELPPKKRRTGSDWRQSSGCNNVCAAQEAERGSVIPVFLAGGQANSAHMHVRPAATRGLLLGSAWPWRRRAGVDAICRSYSSRQRPCTRCLSMRRRRSTSVLSRSRSSPWPTRKIRAGMRSYTNSRSTGAPIPENKQSTHQSALSTRIHLV